MHGKPFQYTPDQEQTLNNIASQNPLIAGHAVYSACVMLGLDCELNASEINMKMMGEDGLTDDESTPKGKLYPNPNNGNMQYDYGLSIGSVGEFIIFDVAGKEVAIYKLSEGENNTLKISEAALKNGIYFYQVSVNGHTAEHNKLIIIK